jgi:class 3 adenylate cyclase/tetratricopeptide (TPR) repeat protein
VTEPPTVRDRLRPYLPRLTLEWLATGPDERHRAVDGSVVFVDISGFTKLSEKLARFGRVGAEEMADSINRCFAELLAIAYEGNGSLLKFGGDALLLLFTGDDHVAQAARAAHGMRSRLRAVGKLDTTGGRVQLRMSVGVHTGRFDFFFVGESHRELLVTGPATTEVVRMEGTADAGEIVISRAVASGIPERCVGEPKGSGMFLRAAPPGAPHDAPWVVPDSMPDELLRRSVSLATREHLIHGSAEPEHRQVTVAFLHFDGTDEMIDRDGPLATADVLHGLVADVQEAVDHHGVSFLGSDADADGGKLILVAGAPLAKGEDEERMLLALRRIADVERKIPIRIGVNHGGVFAGDVGPHYRRTYTVMGDTVNLAARLMAKASPGEIYATASVLDRSSTRFTVTELEPFMVKGKAKPVQAWSVGAPIGSRSRDATPEQLPIVGRSAELAVLAKAVDDARHGAGTLIEIVGEPGIGKSRLLKEQQAAAEDLILLTATAEAYTSSTPYVVWRELLRELLDVTWDAADDVVLERLLTLIEAVDPELWTWLPLLAIALDVDVAFSLEVEMLTPEMRRAKLHDVVGRLLEGALHQPTMIVVEDAHLMDSASAELLGSLVERLEDRPWVVVSTRREADTGFRAPEGDRVISLHPEPLDADASLALARLATQASPMLPHDLNVIAERSGGNPQFLLDLVAAASRGSMLPESVEAAATATIDQLGPSDRALVRRASILGVMFHPKFLPDVLDGDDGPPDSSTWERLERFFEDAGGGFVRFRRAVIRDAAYKGLPFRTRRALHGRIARRFEEEYDVEESGGLLSLHFFLAGDHEHAWRYACAAGGRAATQFAHQEAAQLYRRALDASRRLPELPSEDVATITERMGDALEAAGEFGRAGEVYSDARRLVHEPLAHARLLLKRSKLEERLGRFSQALRWATRARRVLEPIESPDAASQRALLDTWYATVLQAEGRTKSAIALAERAVDDAEAAGNIEALAGASFVLGWAYGVLGRSESRTYWERALEAYRDIGDAVKEADVLSNLGTLAQWEGRWDDALEYWELGRDRSTSIGDVVGAAASSDNIAELLADRGEFDRAEALLLESLPLWRASEYRYFLANCLGMLGRVASRSGRFDDALERFTEARSQHVHVGAQAEILDIDARLAERAAFMGQAEGALELATTTLDAAMRSEDEGAMVVPMLERVRGYALFQLGDIPAAREAWSSSLGSARARGQRFELMLTAHASIRIARLLGEEPSSELREEAEDILRTLKIVAVPAVPLAASER